MGAAHEAVAGYLLGLILSCVGVFLTPGDHLLGPAEITGCNKQLNASTERQGRIHRATIVRDYVSLDSVGHE